VETGELRPRRDGRRKVRTDASLRDAAGGALGAELTDLSANGCRVELDEGAFDEDQVVIVQPGALGGVAGRVRWTRGNAAGVEFADPLHPAVVDHVTGERDLEGHAPPPKRKGESGFTDSFGRPLPSLGKQRRR